MGKLLNWNFWLNMSPGSFTSVSFYVFLLILAVFLVLALVSGSFKKKKRGPYFRIWRKLNVFAWSNLLIGLLLLFFAYELIPILSARIWVLLWGAGALVWLGFVLKSIKKIPKIKEKIQKEQEYKKYIP